MRNQIHDVLPVATREILSHPGTRVENGHAYLYNKKYAVRPISGEEFKAEVDKVIALLNPPKKPFWRRLI